MTCEFIQGELVAYRDGELPEQDRERIAAHLQTCVACAHEEAQLARVEHFLVTMERITPSPDFAATFWKRLEQEQTTQVNILPEWERRLIRWWREVRETVTAWHVAPALAAATSLLVFFAYFFTSSPTQRPTGTSAPPPALVPQELAATPGTTVPAGAPADVAEKLELYVNYSIISDLERFSHLEEIAAIELPAENATEIVQEDNLPPELLENPSFFAHYPILQQMDKLQNLEAVLDTPTPEGDSQGRG